MLGDDAGSERNEGANFVTRRRTLTLTLSLTLTLTLDPDPNPDPDPHPNAISQLPSAAAPPRSQMLNSEVG